MSGVIIGVMSLIMSVFFGVRRRLQGTDTRPAEVVNHKRALDLSVAAWVRERDKTHAVAVALHNGTGWRLGVRAPKRKFGV